MITFTMQAQDKANFKKDAIALIEVAGIDIGFESVVF